ncbi:MAG: sigma-70 family RNA polymerase sigma factor [Saprospiraceae bacterium]
MSQPLQPKSEADQVFEQELLPHVNALSAFAYRLAQDADDAADLVQITYMKAYRAIDGYERGSNAKAWLFRILKNAFINEWRKRQNQPTKIDYDEVIKLQEDDSSNVPVYLDLREELFAHLLDDELTHAINSLPVNFRLVLLLCDIEGFTYEEIARITDVPIGTVRSRLHRARNVLKERLRGYAEKKGISDRRTT